MPAKKIIITGGGTGGHVFPALAIAEHLRQNGWEVLYVGTSHGMEARLVAEKNFPFFTVQTGALKNQGLLKKVKTVFLLLKGLLWSARFLREQKPQMVLGVGGYVSAPICLAAFLLRIPVYLQEQNASVGIANRLLGRLARKVFLGFKEAEGCFPKGRSVFTGNPLRTVFYSPEVKTFNAKTNHLLILGGSQGAKAINSAVADLLPRIYERFPEIQITHQTGVTDQPVIEARYKTDAKGPFKVQAFITNMVEAYNESAFVICRAGALTVSELIQVGRPALFVPYPRRGQNDQTANAALVQKAGAGFVVEQGENFTERLWTVLERAFEPENLRKMSEKYSSLRSNNGLDSIRTHLENALPK